MPSPEQIDMKNLELNIRDALAKEHNWDKQQEHWELQQEHWKRQSKHWNWVVGLAAIAILVNGLAQLFGGT